MVYIISKGITDSVSYKDYKDKGWRQVRRKGADCIVITDETVPDKKAAEQQQKPY
ncbi:MAG: hypothetical protein QXG99_03965 [Conexivisphaerales archaeon]